MTQYIAVVSGRARATVVEFSCNSENIIDIVMAANQATKLELGEDVLSISRVIWKRGS
jgi:hypothetical protein